MKKSTIMIYAIEIFIFIFAFALYMLTQVISSSIKGYLAITFLLLILIACVALFGFSRKKGYYSNYAFLVVLTVLMASGILIYLLGLLLGFSKGYGFFNRIVSSIIPIVGVVLFSELIRKTISDVSFTNKKSFIISSIALALFQVSFEFNTSVLRESYSIFVFISTVILPVFAESFLCTYLVYKSSYKNSILFRIVVELYLYILPIIPNLGYYIFAFIKIMVPFIIFSIINRTVLQEERSRKIIRKNNIVIFSIPFLLASFILVILVSGIFQYKLVAIATNSMSQTFSRGDAVLIEYTSPSEIEVGDVMAFRHNNIIVTHRVVEVTKRNDTDISFRTKGDANDHIDGYVISSDEVIGKINFVVKYIGYPTILMNELSFKKE